MQLRHSKGAARNYDPFRRSELHLFEQHVTSSQQRSHFFRHENGLPHTKHILDGKFSLLIFVLVSTPLPRAFKADLKKARGRPTVGMKHPEELCKRPATSVVLRQTRPMPIK